MTELKEILGEALNAVRKIRSAPEKFVPAMVFDVLFFVAYGFVTRPLFSKIVDYVIILGSIVGEKAPEIARGTNQGISSIIMSDPQASQILNKLILIFILLAVSIYLVYVFFQGIAWKFSADIAGKKTSINNYMKKFALVNVFWIALFSVQHLLSLFSDIRSSVLQNLNMAPSSSFSVFVAVLLFAISYFAFISYALIGTRGKKIKKSFYIGTRKIAYFVPAYVVIAIVYFILKNLMEALAGVDFSLMVFVGIFTIIPAMSWARVYLTLVVENLK